ncbi:hypothetical protein BCR34DRAFT_558886 [Clohesyomyces aquaticus]|uniref:Uncharacterized protein n=1 Tax=Clohesyomyces aquaticus TaxID=1231657 RepID=A0A1Y1ZYY0_9PLEO|nr:hypothetical protein BCR34DRAFT_558886 [Clohesyomyces aquaticus]
MTSSTASATPTVPVSLLALTTPFVAPPNCADVFTTVKTVTSDYLHNDTESTLTVVFSDPSDPRFTKCQPQGWDGVVPESRFHFSPAVCPDRWTAYNLGTVYLDAVRRATTAYCCAR